MTLRLTLPEELESAIRSLCAQTGDSPESIAIHCLSAELLAGNRRTNTRSPDQRLAALREWANAPRPMIPVADDSRSSIYDDRT